MRSHDEGPTKERSLAQAKAESPTVYERYMNIRSVAPLGPSQYLLVPVLVLFLCQALQVDY